MNNEYNDGFSIDDNKPLPNIILNIIIKIFETIELINVNGSDGLISLDELIEYIKNNNELLDINDESCNNLNFKYIKQDIKILIEEINNKNKEYEEIKSKNKELEIKNNFLCEEIEKYKKIEIELKNKINKINNNEKNNKLKLEDITELCTMLEN
jgi:predicted nuclease with TOPRIM domain